MKSTAVVADPEIIYASEKSIYLADTYWSDGGYFTPHCATLHPARLARGLADVVEARGVQLFEGSPATRLEKGRVYTPGGSLRADLVLRAHAASAQGASALMEPRLAAFRERFGDAIYSEDEPDLAVAVGRMLLERGVTLATAESCTGGLVAKNRANHKCQFVSADDNWVWESSDLVREDKRSMPGDEGGFRAIALLPIVEGMQLDVVRARMRQGQHNVERVTSMTVRRGRLVEVEQRDVSARGAR